jgi:hypothetical protein
MSRFRQNEMNHMWTQAEIDSALRMIQEKKTIEEIARRQERSAPSVYSKLKWIAADMYFNERVPFDKIEELTGVKKNSIVLTAKGKVDPEEEVILDIKPSPTLAPNIPTYSISTESPFTLDTFYNEISTPIIKGIISSITNELNRVTSQIQH